MLTPQCPPVPRPSSSCCGPPSRARSDGSLGALAWRRFLLWGLVLLLTGAAGPAFARWACPDNLVRDGGIESGSPWTPRIGSPDFASGMGAIDRGYVGMWGNRVVGEALLQTLPSGLVAGRTYLISMRARHVVDPGKQPYSRVRLVGWPAGAAPATYEDLFTAPREQIGVSPQISNIDWTPVSFGPWTATSDLEGIAVHVVNDSQRDHGSETSYAHLDNVCVREPVPPKLCGKKYRDAACDGERDPGDGGLAGWEIALIGPDGVIRTTTTGPDGGYCFDDLAPGSYRVTESARPGWVQTAPRTGGEHRVEVPLEGDLEGLDFGNQLCARCPKDDCADPRDPRVEYVVEDAEVCKVIRYTCDPGMEHFSDDCGCGCLAPCTRTATAAGLHYPGETCSSAIARAESSYGSGHYRRACEQAHGEAPDGPVGVEAVTSCQSRDDGVYLDVEVCCPEPPGEPDLAVRKELVGPTEDDSVHLIFRITVENRGDAPMAGPVEVRDLLPQGYGFVSAQGCTASGSQVTCTHVGDLAAGEVVAFEVVTRLDRAAFQDRTNCVALASDAGGGDPSDDTACLPLLCPRRDDPSVHYLVDRGSREDHARCPRLLGRCGDDQRPFWGACGCGCIDEPRCIEPAEWKADVPPRQLETSDPATDLEGLLALPGELRPGDRVAVTPLDPARTPPGGTWRINGRVVERRDPRPSVLCPRPWWSFDVPRDWASGLDLVVTYTDPAGDVLVDARPEVEVGEPVGDGGEPPWIEGGTTFTTPGGEACVCGSFPTLEARSALLLDGRALGMPTAAGRGSVSFRLPADLPPGEHEVSGWIGAGFGEGARRWPLAVGEVRASLDTSTLARGGSTRLLLQVMGSERPVTLRLRNFSPSVVVVEGGDDQTLTTSGGAENVVTVQVRGVGQGDFDLRWELPGCPCAG